MSAGGTGGFMPVGPTEPGGDPEALSDEREEYPDPEDYPLPDPADTGDGETPDADLQVGGHD
jgi:hypothetical protein